MIKHGVFWLLALCPAMAWAVDITWPEAQITLIGEVHDDPAHHRVQGEITAKLSPSVLAFEMLPASVSLDLSLMDVADLEALDAALGWTGSGWPELAIYHPIFLAAPEAQVVGIAPPQEDVRRAIEEGAAQVFGDEAAQFGLTTPLDPAEQAAREMMQGAAHCDALPEALLPGFVEAQRFRDAAFARASLDAYRSFGGPVVVITGNGHVRDWGMPRALQTAAPEVTVTAIAQLYEGDGAQGYGVTLNSNAPLQSSDPCAAFESK